MASPACVPSTITNRLGFIKQGERLNVATHSSPPSRRVATVVEEPREFLSDWRVMVLWEDTKRIQMIDCMRCEPIKGPPHHDNKDTRIKNGAATLSVAVNKTNPYVVTLQGEQQPPKHQQPRKQAPKDKVSETGDAPNPLIHSTKGGQDSGCSVKESPSSLPPSPPRKSRSAKRQEALAVAGDTNERRDRTVRFSLFEQTSPTGISTEEASVQSPHAARYPVNSFLKSKTSMDDTTHRYGRPPFDEIPSIVTPDSVMGNNASTSFSNQKMNRKSCNLSKDERKPAARMPRDAPQISPTKQDTHNYQIGDINSKRKAKQQKREHVATRTSPTEYSKRSAIHFQELQFMSHRLVARYENGNAPYENLTVSTGFQMGDESTTKKSDVAPTPVKSMPVIDNVEFVSPQLTAFYALSTIGKNRIGKKRSRAERRASKPGPIPTEGPDFVDLTGIETDSDDDGGADGVDDKVDRNEQEVANDTLTEKPEGEQQRGSTNSAESNVNKVDILGDKTVIQGANMHGRDRGVDLTTGNFNNDGPSIVFRGGIWEDVPGDLTDQEDRVSAASSVGAVGHASVERNKYKGISADAQGMDVIANRGGDKDGDDDRAALKSDSVVDLTTASSTDDEETSVEYAALERNKYEDVNDLKLQGVNSHGVVKGGIYKGILGDCTSRTSAASLDAAAERNNCKGAAHAQGADVANESGGKDGDDAAMEADEGSEHGSDDVVDLAASSDDEEIASVGFLLDDDYKGNSWVDTQLEVEQQRREFQKYLALREAAEELHAEITKDRAVIQRPYAERPPTRTPISHPLLLAPLPPSSKQVGKPIPIQHPLNLAPVGPPPRRVRKTAEQRELEQRRHFFTSVHVSCGTDQCDPGGAGCVARRPLHVGEEFVDPYAIYRFGEPPNSGYCERGSYIKTREGYFALVPSATEWVNEPSGGKLANIVFKSKYRTYGSRAGSKEGVKPLLVWRVIRPVQAGEEVLAEYGGCPVNYPPHARVVF